MTDIIQVIETLCDKVGIAIDWTSNNVLPMIQEMISRYSTAKVIEHAIGIFVPLMFIIVGVIAIDCAIKSYEKEHNGTLVGLDDCEPQFWLIIFGILAIVISLIVAIVNSIYLVQWAYIPEIMILKMLK